MSTLTNMVFDKVLLLGEGESLVLPFESKKDLLSKKVLFYRERREYKTAFPEAADIFIQQKIVESEKRYELILSCHVSSISWLSKAVIKKEDGHCESVQIVPEGASLGVLSEVDRIRNMMLKDGCSAEEINETLAAINSEI